MIAGPIQPVTVKLFGPQAALAGTHAVEVPAPVGVSAKNLKLLLAESHPKLVPSLPASRIAVDHEYAGPDDPIPDGAEIALIGLVSGG